MKIAMAESKSKVKYPPVVMPVSLVGANVAGKPNFEPIAWFCFLESQPILVGIASDKQHYTNMGIHENKTFSVNIPSADMAVATDFCGLHSGAKLDKSVVFDVFYGELKTAPMISECPVNMECKLVKTMLFVHDEFLVGEVVCVYVDGKCLTDEKPDMTKINPLLYEGGVSPSYWRLGEHLARAFEIGKEYKLKPKPRRKC